jgi:hypothetical protein
MISLIPAPPDNGRVFGGFLKLIIIIRYVLYRKYATVSGEGAPQEIEAAT